MECTEEQIERIAELAGDPANLRAADPEAWDSARCMAGAISDTFTDHDWATLLNGLSTDRAARQIARRPSEERAFLLSLIRPERRAKVEAQLPVMA